MPSLGDRRLDRKRYFLGGHRLSGRKRDNHFRNTIVGLYGLGQWSLCRGVYQLGASGQGSEIQHR